MGGLTGTKHYTFMKHDRSRLTVKDDRPSIISTPMISTVNQYTVDKYIVKVDNQNHKRKVDRKVSPRLAITNLSQLPRTFFAVLVC